MAFRRAAPDASALVKNPAQLADWIRDIHNRVEKVEKHTGTEAVSSRQRSPITAKPPRAGLTVSASAGKGRWQVTLRNPQFGNPAGTGQHTPKPIYHRLEYSPDASFRSAVTTLEPSHQTFFPIIEDPNQTLYFRLASSYDGVNWNLPQYGQAQG